MTHLLFVVADLPHEWNCSQWRIVNPAWGLRRIGVTVDEMWINDWAQSPTVREPRDRVNKADAILFQRNAFEGNLEAIKFWRSMGKPVYIDLDDAYQALPDTVNAKKFWEGNSQNYRRGPLEQLREGLALASGLTSPSKVILDDWTAPTKHWLPNYVRGEWYRDLDERVDAAGVRDAQDSRLEGFPYLRVNRLLSSFRAEAAADPRVLGALTRARACDRRAVSDGREVEDRGDEPRHRGHRLAVTLTGGPALAPRKPVRERGDPREPGRAEQVGERAPAERRLAGGRRTSARGPVAARRRPHRERAGREHGEQGEDAHGG